jgi:hypothetical protein
MAQILDHPVLPDDAVIPATGGASVALQNLGQAAAQRVALREEKLTELEIRGEIKPATILNRSPFELKVETGLWGYVVPPRPEGKPFSSLTVKGCITVPIYRGNMEMSDKSLRQRFDMKVLLPIHQLMEFKHWYVGETDEDRLAKSGGVVVFEGDMEDITPASMVRTPEFVFRKGRRYLKFSEYRLKDLLDQADEQMYQHCFAVLYEANADADDPQKRKNIQNYQRTVAQFMLQQKKIQNAPPWMNVQLAAADCCPRCNAQYVSKTGVCKCSFVVDPLAAYMQSEIAVDHVRMNILTAEQWKKVNAEEDRRQKAREAK